jgi:hypothetical protein
MTEPNVTASSNPVVARNHGLTEWDRERGQWVKPAPAESEEPTDEPARNPFEDSEQIDRIIAKLTKKQLSAELSNRHIEHDPSARNDVLIGLLEENDRATAEHGA